MSRRSCWRCVPRAAAVADPPCAASSHASPLASHTHTHSQCFLSAGDKQLAVFFHLPKELSASKGITLKEWATAVLAPVEGHTVGGWARPRLELLGLAGAGAGACPQWRRQRCVGGSTAGRVGGDASAAAQLGAAARLLLTPFAAPLTDRLHPLPAVDACTQIVEESEEFLKATSPADMDKGRFPLKQVRVRVAERGRTSTCLSSV